MSNLPANRPAGRPTYLDTQPGLIELVAEMYAAGMTQEKMMSELPISTPASLREWLKDERVLTIVEKIHRARALRVVRKVDSSVEARLLDDKQRAQMSVETLLKIRKEYVPETIDSPKGASKTDIMSKLWLRAGRDPVLAALLTELSIDNPDADVPIPAELPAGDEPEAEIDVEMVTRMAEIEDDIEPEEGT